MNHKLYGNKESFAIELKLTTQSDIGYNRLWVQGKYLGCFNDQVYISYLESDNYNLLIRSFGEAFDDFIVITYIENEMIYFIWKLVNQPYFSYPEYLNKVFIESVSLSFFLDVLQEFFTEREFMRNKNS